MGNRKPKNDARMSILELRNIGYSGFSYCLLNYIFCIM